jgi:outer membrane protein OmpA-like peptidoglycan-associated protein
MRTLALTLLACGTVAMSQAAVAQDPPASVEDYVCELSGDCAEQPADATPAPADGPRVSASRGFALSRPDSARPARPAAAPATQRRTARTVRQRTSQAAPRQAAAPGQRLNLRLTFMTGSATLTAAARQQAEIFAQSLQRPQLMNMRFAIEGHTDAVGTRTRNVDLSQRRAQAVADLLIGAGVDRSRLEVRGFGPDRPLPGTARSSSENRRVEAVRVS